MFLTISSSFTQSQIKQDISLLVIIETRAIMLITIRLREEKSVLSLHPIQMATEAEFTSRQARPYIPWWGELIPTNLPTPITVKLCLLVVRSVIWEISVNQTHFKNNVRENQGLEAAGRSTERSPPMRNRPVLTTETYIFRPRAERGTNVSIRPSLGFGGNRAEANPSKIHPDVLAQRPVNIVCEGPNSQYFRLFWPYGLLSQLLNSVLVM